MYIVNVNPGQEPQGKIGTSTYHGVTLRNPILGACHFILDTKKELKTAKLAVALWSSTFGQRDHKPLIVLDAADHKGPVFGGLLDLMEYLAYGTVEAHWTGRRE
jgi:hypothetical protein